MTQADLFRWLLESTCASSAAIVLVLLLRRPLRAAFGANAAYLLWSLLPLSVLVASLPARVVRVVVREAAGSVGMGGIAPAVPADTAVTATAWLLLAWLAGAAGFLSWQVVVQRRFQRSLGVVRADRDGNLRAEARSGLPAVIGLRARIVLPADFEVRYDADERALILAHERIHLARRDVLGNALLVTLRCAYWFNPLVLVAVDRFRRDQELACDETVVARHPHARRAYGEAMVKTQLSVMPAPLACHWFGGHPLKERIAMLKRPVPGKRRVFAGLALVAALVCGGTWAAWTARPPVTVVASADPVRATPAADADSAPAKPESKAITLSAVRQPAREIVKEAARLAGLRVLDPQVVSEKPLTLEFSNMSVGVIMSLVAEETGLVASYEGDIVSFRPRTAADPAIVRAGGQADCDAHVNEPSKQLAPPKYPADAAANKVTGKVVVIVDVAADGSVADARVEKSEPAGVFDQATLEAVRKWKFEPAIQGGRPVAGRVRVPVTFGMDKPAAASTGGAGSQA